MAWRPGTPGPFHLDPWWAMPGFFPGADRPGLFDMPNETHMERELVLRNVWGSYAESFRILPLYCIELQKTNPSTPTNIDITSDNRFRYFFWGFGLCLRLFQTSLRPLIVVDGTHLRRKSLGVLLVAITHDAKSLVVSHSIRLRRSRALWQLEVVPCLLFNGIGWAKKFDNCVHPLKSSLKNVTLPLHTSKKSHEAASRYNGRSFFKHQILSK